MKIDIAHIAKLSRLHIEPEKMEDELTLDAEHPMKLREDVAVEHKFRREEMLANAPVVQSGCLVVPKTVE